MLKVVVLIVVVMAGLSLAGCKHGSLQGAIPGTGTGEMIGEPGIQEGDGGPGDWHGLLTIYFDFDSAAISPEAMATLKSNAERIKSVPKIVIQIAGHCDSRGTQEYNLALGERRALAVRTFLIQCGVSGDRLVTISYGSEFPAVPGNNETAWSKNRRVEFNPGK
jgi:peptidoglycan-associated lipoprotein